MKDSFVLYTKYSEQLDLLTMEQRGELITAIFEYMKGNDPNIDGVVAMAFSFIKTQLDADTEKYEEVCRKRAEAGKMGGRPKKQMLSDENQEKAKKANGFSEKQTKAKKADNDNDNDNDNDISKDISNTTKSDKPIVVKHEPYMVEFDRLWQAYPRKEGRKEAMKAYERSRKAGTTYETIKDGIDRYNDHIKAEKTERRFIMQGSTFFRGERWADTWETSRKTTSFANFKERKYDSDTMLGLIEM